MMTLYEIISHLLVKSHNHDCRNYRDVDNCGSQHALYRKWFKQCVAYKIKLSWYYIKLDTMCALHLVHVYCLTIKHFSYYIELTYVGN